MSNIKLRVKEILKEKGISQKELAEKLDITEVGLSKAINEDGNPSLKRLGEIAEILEVEITELFATRKQSAFSCPKCGTNLAIVEA